MTLGLSVVVWVVTVILQAYSTFARYVGAFSSGCQITGYPVDLCELPTSSVPAVIIIVVNISFWFLVINLIFGWFSKPDSPSKNS
ncbi:MAG: hypothetical protein UV41_C0011G0030 [Candidatus Daviesbacteria bacterium GW2011_GWA2_42_7]|uniref:Uncharacterized protein n=1 Tax=Candidatus Daviesbacteria bacterium GW2011_GWA2_42_7 TaxID=1618425 RepID=A0A0G1E8G2_9BACT|nr:MAG: hypothetical protein UV41_C0011G0030 [Candidatus Daviesbacteria bacterium GW2011_GWA2_42_7]